MERSRVWDHRSMAWQILTCSSWSTTIAQCICCETWLAILAIKAPTYRLQRAAPPILQRLHFCDVPGNITNPLIRRSKIQAPHSKRRRATRKSHRWTLARRHLLSCDTRQASVRDELAVDRRPHLDRGAVGRPQLHKSSTLQRCMGRARIFYRHHHLFHYIANVQI